MEILRKSSFTPVPWKNGGGITNEAFRVPPGADAYRWRLSVAEIGVSGPFSSFAGYHRTMALLAGSGVKLSFADGVQAHLREPGDLLQFDGAIPTQCDLLGGPCTDLNLIVSNALSKPAVRIESPLAPLSIVSEGGRTTLLFVVRGTFSIAYAAAPTMLGTWDLAVLAPRDEISLVPVAVDGPNAPLVFCATLDDNC